MRGKHTEESKRKISIARSKFLEENENGGGFSDVAWYRVSNILGEEFVVRGLLERDIAELLNLEDRIWVRKVYLNYYDEAGNYRTYAPDFYLPEEDHYIEAKGYFPEKDQQKLNLVVEQNEIACLSILFDTWADVDRSDYKPGSKRRRGASAVRQQGHVAYTDCIICGTPTRSLRARHVKCRTTPTTRYTKITWPSVHDLVARIKNTNLEAVSRELSVSGNAVRKYLRKNGLDSREI